MVNTIVRPTHVWNVDIYDGWTALASTTSPGTLVALERRGLITIDRCTVPSGGVAMVRGYAGEYMVDVTELGLAFAVQYLAE